MFEPLRRLFYLLRQRRHDADLAEELVWHRELKQRELEARGLPANEAAVAARRALGNDLAARQHARDVWVWPPLQDLAQDAGFGLRLLLHDRGFAVLAIVVLGFGIGVNNMLFTVLYAHTLRGLPISHVDRVLYVSASDARVADRPLSRGEFEALRDEATLFGDLAAFVSRPIALSEARRAAERFDAAYVSANALTLLGIAPIRGRGFATSDDAAGAALVAMLGDDAWTRHYQRDPAIVGRIVRIDGVPAEIIGVLPSRAGFPSSAEVWLPLVALPDVGGGPRLAVLGRLKEQALPSDAQAQADLLLRQTSPPANADASTLRARIVPINNRVLGRVTDPAWSAFMAFGFVVLLISCANVANLLLTRATSRAREVAVRTALGATRMRLVRQLMVESIVLALAGGLVGLLVSLAGVRLFASAIPAGVLPYWLEYRMDARVFAWLAVVSLATVIVFGPVSALYASRQNAVRTITTAGRTIISKRTPRRWTTAFVAMQIGLTVVGLAYYVIGVQTAAVKISSDDVLDSPDLLTATVSLPSATYRTAGDRRRFFDRLAASAVTMPGMTSVALASTLPRGGAEERRLEIEGRPSGDAPIVRSIAVGPAYFATLGLPVERGREFGSADSSGEPHVVVNLRLAELLFPQSDPIGKRVRFTTNSPGAAPTPWLAIVGVAPDIRQRVTATPEPIVYLPFDSVSPATAHLVMRVAAPVTAFADELRTRVSALDPDLPVYRVLTLSQVIDDAEWNGRVSQRTVRAITLLALLFSLAGIYAVAAHTVVDRSREMSVRVALGAAPAQLCVLILKSALLQVALGFAIGVFCTLAWNAAFFTGAANVRLATPGVLGPVALLLVAGMCVACLLPARRAMRLDAVAVLRSE